jgi:hypothetical protein
MSQYTLNAYEMLRHFATQYVTEYGFVLTPILEGRGASGVFKKYGKDPETLVDTVAKIDLYWPASNLIKKNTPRYNIAIVCGPSGIVAIDFDSDHEEYGQVGGHMNMSGPALLDTLVDTYKQRTPGGGVHMLYRYDHTVGPIKNHTSKLIPAVDIKGLGGLCVLAPTQKYTTNKTTTADGEIITHAIMPGRRGHAVTGQYSIIDKRQPAPIPPSLRDAILEMQDKKKTDTTRTYAVILPTHTVTSSADPTHASAAHYLDTAVGNASTGNRNDTGLWLCLQLRDLRLSESDIRTYAYLYVDRVGDGTYTDAEIDATIDQVMSQSPRTPAYIKEHTDDPVGPLTDADVDALDASMRTPSARTRTDEKDPYNHPAETPIGPQNGNGEVRRGNAPTLPAYATIDDHVGVDACPWLDDYVAYSCTWSTRAWSSFHTAVGLWVMSTIAARRVMVEGGAGQLHHTGLFLLLTAPTSTYAKTTTARIGLDTINDAGLSHLLLPDDLTPQALVRRMSSTTVELPTSVTPKTKDTAECVLQFAAQRGWIYEEFGSKLTAMMNDASNHSEYKRLFRVIYDSLPTFETETLTRGNEKIYRPYIALLGNLTPADLVRYAGKNNNLWNDGFWPRFIFASPPKDTAAEYTTAPTGQRLTPQHITAPLRDWHLSMRIPEIETRVDAVEKEKRRKTADVKKPDVVEKYVMTKDPDAHPETVIGWDVDARNAMQRYDQAMVTMCRTIPEDLRGLYTRQPNKALRIAGLFASMAGSSTITLSHYARAQAIMESFRVELHNVYDTTATTTVETGARKIEDKLIQMIGAHVTGVTKRDIYRRSHLDTDTVEKTLLRLQANGIITRTNEGKTTIYTLSTTAD